MSFRFLHSSDLHLGKRFGNIADETLRGRLRDARHTVLGRLAARAREQGAGTILLAGDSFDTETPSPDIRRQALAEMGHHAPLRWVLLPGNHDSLQASQLWSAIRAEAPPNVVFATEPAPVELAPGVVLLPAPCTARRPGRDLTEWMDAAPTPEGTLRLGLAHGAMRDFSEEGVGLDVLAPDRAARAGLAYLALGDWHGAMALDARTRYSGTPEPDRFKHDRPGEALVVSLSAPAAAPEVMPVETASFSWRMLPLHLLSGDDGAERLAGLLPPGPARRQTLARLVATGRASLAGRSALAAAIDHAAPEFALLELDESGLMNDIEAEDLDLIDRAGALREAAEALRAESLDAARPAAERAIARAALARLFSLSQRVGS
ncbi:metallophosphoesterase family protein [Ancylobacter oerskovii]|uniref:Exonuclease SbcCD subunit D n=1 Tax=Ancylobacter oerskovii TaxID=459519 RepID=A0ABW4YY66_9HYPH|nr:DNA repair exonuclease [Ancylobacter oerskovii]MBS7541908.1 DNA repair exonuclease [Ancylobacter oerskovii]